LLAMKALLDIMILEDGEDGDTGEYSRDAQDVDQEMAGDDAVTAGATDIIVGRSPPDGAGEAAGEAAEQSTDDTKPKIEEREDAEMAM
jgi:ethanolamine utilization microcompartment shell protein EutL